MTATAVEQTRGWTVDASTFGARLALVRHRMGWNTKEAAIACGIAPASWTNWESAGMLPRRYIQTCKQIASRTGCDLMWLIDIDANGMNGPNRRYGQHVLQTRPVGHPDETIRPPKLPGSRRSVINRARYAA